MRLTMCVSDHAVSMRGVPKGISSEALADYAHTLRAEVLAVYSLAEAPAPTTLAE